MRDLKPGEHLCRQRHHLEWAAPVPRSGPCDECVALDVIVREGVTINEALGRVS